MTGPKPFDPQNEQVCVEGDFTIDLQGCARCNGEGHEQLTFHRLTNPMVIDYPSDDVYLNFTHWAPCPTNGEPIMLAVT